MKKAALLIIASALMASTVYASDIAVRLRDNPDGALNGDIVFAAVVTGFLIDLDLPEPAASTVSFSGAAAKAALDEHILSNGGTAITTQESLDVGGGSNSMRACYATLNATQRAIYRDILPHYTWMLQQVNSDPAWAAIMSVAKWDAIFIDCGQQTADAGGESLDGEIALIEQTALDASAAVADVQEDTEKVNRKAGLALSRADRSIAHDAEQDAAIAQLQADLAMMMTIEVADTP